MFISSIKNKQIRYAYFSMRPDALPSAAGLHLHTSRHQIATRRAKRTAQVEKIGKTPIYP
jgi:hypothetical protein